jgi:hypothetical protein
MKASRSSLFISVKERDVHKIISSFLYRILVLLSYGSLSNNDFLLQPPLTVKSRKTPKACPGKDPPLVAHVIAALVVYQVMNLWTSPRLTYGIFFALNNRERSIPATQGHSRVIDIVPIFLRKKRPKSKSNPYPFTGSKIRSVQKMVHKVAGFVTHFNELLQAVSNSHMDCRWRLLYRRNTD